MPVTKAMEEIKIACTIFMDDICLQAPTRWKLRKAIKHLNTVFNALKIMKHPDKTEIGHVKKGFDFLGFHHPIDQQGGSSCNFRKVCCEVISPLRGNR